jgi:hypothetical protein
MDLVSRAISYWSRAGHGNPLRMAPLASPGQEPAGRAPRWARWANGDVAAAILVHQTGVAVGIGGYLWGYSVSIQSPIWSSTGYSDEYI